MSEKPIESVLTESRQFPPQAEFAAAAHPNAQELARLRSLASLGSEAFWAAQAREKLAWERPFTQVLDASSAPNYRWFSDGTLNV